MKLLICAKCGDMNTLGYKRKDCSCGAVGGYYNADGDTATVWGTDKWGRLFGLNNQMIARAFQGTRVEAKDGSGVLWPYDMDNGKITVLPSAKPDNGGRTRISRRLGFG